MLHTTLSFWSEPATHGKVIGLHIWNLVQRVTWSLWSSGGHAFWGHLAAQATCTYIRVYNAEKIVWNMMHVLPASCKLISKCDSDSSDQSWRCLVKADEELLVFRDRENTWYDVTGLNTCSEAERTHNIKVKKLKSRTTVPEISLPWQWRKIKHMQVKLSSKYSHYKAKQTDEFFASFSL